MPQTVFKRRLVGQQAGVQVNMPIDRVTRLLPETGDQTFAVAGKFSRGRTDKPFLVAAHKLVRYLGDPKSMRANAANETYVQIFEAFSAGAAAAVVSRIQSAEAKNRWIVFKHGASGNIVLAEEMPTASDNSWLAAMRVADCINDGVFVSVQKGDSADELIIEVRERHKNARGEDIGEGEVLYTFAGSTNPEAKDGVGSSYYLADIAAKYYGDWLEIAVNATAAAAVKSDDAFDKKAVSAAVVPYTDNGTPDTADYQRAAKALGRTALQYRYILSESSNTVLVAALLEVAQQYNRIMVQDIAGNLTPEAAIRWKDSFQYDGQGGMYCLWLWSPNKRNDPTGATGQYLFGTSGQKVGKACARNALINNFGLPPLNRPIAGKNFYLTGTGFAQLYAPDDPELAALAKAHINPVAYAVYHDGSGYVFDDSLTGAKRNGISRLENAIEISHWLQEQFGKYARSLLQEPMTEALRLMRRFAESTLQACEASGWLTVSAELGGRAYAYVVAPNERNPEDEMMVELNIAIDGVVRRIFISTNMYSRS